MENPNALFLAFPNCFRSMANQAYGMVELMHNRIHDHINHILCLS